MILLIGLPEAIAVVLAVAGVAALAATWHWRRRLAQLRRSLTANRQGELAEVIREFKHQANHTLRPMKDGLALIRQEVGQLPPTNQSLADRVADSLRDVEHYDWRLTRLIENLALVSQLETPDAVISFSQVSLETIVDDVVKEFQPVAEANGVELSWWIKGPALPRITANATGLHQVLINLVDNAIKYSPDKGQVDVILEGDRARGVVSIKVQDNGPGIPPDDLALIFQRGYSVEKAQGRPTKGGQGLGLYIVQLIADRHRGHVGVESRLGQGTTFTVTLPIGRI